MIIYLIIAFFSFYFVGHMFLSSMVDLKSVRDNRRVFNKLFWGIVLTISIYSIIKTYFLTINITFIIILLSFYYFNKSSINIRLSWDRLNFKNDFKVLAKSLLIIAGLFSFYYFNIFYSEEQLHVINGDTLKHVIRAMFLHQTGIESGNINYFSLPDGVEPFHYFEAWLTTFLGELFKITYWKSIQLIVLPLIQTIIVIGVWSIVEKWSSTNITYLLSSFILLISGFYFDFLVEKIPFFNFTHGFSNNTIDEYAAVKVSVAYFGVIHALSHLFNHHRKELFIVSLLILPILSFTFLPLILCLTTFLIIYYKIKCSQKTSNLIISLPILITLTIFIFYKLNKPTTVLINTSGYFSNIVSWGNLPFRLFLGIEKFVQFILLYSPYWILILVFLLRHRHKVHLRIATETILILGVSVVASFIGWILLYDQFGANNLLFYTMIPFVNVTLLLSIIYAYTNSKTYLRYIISMFIIFTFILFTLRSSENITNWKSKLKYSTTYISAVINEFNNSESRFGLKVENMNKLNFYNDAHDKVGFFVSGIYNNVSLHSISIPQMFIDNKVPESQIGLAKNAPITAQYLFTKQRNPSVELSDVVLKTIAEYYIKFVFVEKGANLPDYLVSKIKTVYSDPISGEKFYILNH